MQYTISIEEPCSDIKYHKGELEMTLKELITVYGGDEAIQEDFSMLSDVLEHEEKQIRLCFDDTNENSEKYNAVTDDVILPVSHPALIAWYEYKVAFIDVPQKDVIDVYFTNVRLNN
jgi:hypothetical protein